MIAYFDEPFELESLFFNAMTPGDENHFGKKYVNVFELARWDDGKLYWVLQAYWQDYNHLAGLIKLDPAIRVRGRVPNGKSVPVSSLGEYKIPFHEEDIQ